MTNGTVCRRYRCARCWGALVEKFVDGEFVVVCASDATHEGIVTQTFVESRRTLDRLEASEVGSRYAVILGLPKTDLKADSRALYGSE